jgi:hypothetical protein
MSILAISHVCGPNAGGLLKSYSCLKEDVDAIPAVGAGTLIVSTAITNKTGKNFVEWYFTPDKGKLNINKVGDKDGQSYESTVEYFIPGLSAAKELEFDKTTNCQIIHICKDQQGNLRILGDLDRGAYIETTETTTGGPMADTPGTLVRIKYNSKQPPFYYTSAVPLTPAP